MGKTAIEWTDHSVNPIRARDKETGAVGHACIKISTGCAHCYSSRFQPRRGMPAFTARIKPTIETFLDEKKLQEVIRRRKPTKYFWCDMTDLFGEWVPFELIAKCFAAMALSPQHTHQVLTKRPDRAFEFFAWAEQQWPQLFPGAPDETIDANVVLQFFSDKEAGRRVAADDFVPPWPLPNVWLGVSTETQEFADLRIPQLLKCPAAVRFLSMEPLLGRIQLEQLQHDGTVEIDCLRGKCGVHRPLQGDCRKVDWVIVGGESGNGARPMNPEWVRDIRDQCQAAGVPFFFKQWGNWVDEFHEAARDIAIANWSEAFVEKVRDSNGQEIDYTGVYMANVGKGVAGRMLDGREYSEFPEVPCLD